MSNSNRLPARVKALNRANAIANRYFSVFADMWRPFVGEQLYKADGELFKKIKERVQTYLPGTELGEGQIMFQYQSKSYAINYEVKTCEQPEGNAGCTYERATIYVGEVRDGVLIHLREPQPLRTNWTAEEVIANREAYKVIDRARDQAENNLRPFGHHDN